MIAAVAYGATMLSNLLDFGAIIHGWEGLGFTEGIMLLAAAASSIVIGRSTLSWLRLPSLSLRGLVGAGLGLGAALASAELLGLVVAFSDGMMVAQYGGEGGGLPLALLVIAGLVPLLEEWLFRGVILECMLAVFPAHAATVVTALLFAILHLSPPTIVHHGLVGYVCGRVRVGTGSLWAAIACHALYNAAVVLRVW
jgi:membrane protease YdiL (CAAX protease family)